MTPEELLLGSIPMRIQKNLQPPLAPKKPTAFSHHKDHRLDDYYWMKDLKDPDTLKYIKAENKYTEAQFEPLNAFKEKLFKELKRTVNEKDISAPVQKGPWIYYSTVKKGQQYRVYYRKPKKGGKAQLLLDCNQLAKGKKYFSLGCFEISPNQDWLAYGCDFSGNETFTIFFKNLKTGRLEKTKIEKASGDLTWVNDNETVYYTELDDNHRPHQVLRLQLSPSAKSKPKAEIVYSETDLQHFVSVDKTSDEEWILIHSGGQITSEVWFASANEQTPTFTCVQSRIEGHEYSIDAREGLFYIRSNDKALNFKLMVTPVSKPEMKNWIEFVAEDKDALLEGFLLYRNHLVLSRFRNALPEVLIYNFQTEQYSDLKFKEKAFSLSLGSWNSDFDSNVLRYVIQSPIVPSLTVDYDMTSKKRKIIKEEKVQGFKTSNYKCERITVPAHDGKKIPVTLFYRKGLKRNKKNPVLLYGYGAYGITIQPGFIRRSIPLINRGFIYAIAHIRGGQELGRAWYEDGKFLKKKNTFYDFISTAEWLIKSKWTSPDQIAIMGGSAGGMLMGAVINMRPDLFKVCVAHVPFVDVINTMFDDSLPLTKIEFNEWGNPAEKKYYDYMKSYSPYDNVEKKNYPHLLITGGLHDFRVTYWEPTKWAAKLRDLKTGTETLLLKIKTAAGHFGASGRFDYLKEEADVLAFVIRYLGLPLK
jgi:oligopeptidase B